MVEEISLSLEETNKIRASLGLKIIETASSRNSSKDKTNKNKESLKPPTVQEEPQFIDNDKTYMLRRKLVALKNKGGLNRSKANDDTSFQDDWLSRIGNNPVKISYDEYEDEDEDDLPLIRVSHKVGDIAGEKGMILTLKESSVLADDDDALENENLVHAKEEAKRVQLRQMNRNRRRMRKKIQVSSADVEEDEGEEQDTSMLMIGATKKYNATATEDEASHHKDKLKVSFKELDSETSDGGDFKPAQIKKRKRNVSGGRTKSSNIVLPDQIEAVELKDHDLYDEGLEDEPLVRSKSVKRTRLRSKEATSKEMVSQINKERREREQRAAFIVQSSNALVIDENTTFLESLSTKSLEKGPDKQEEDQWPKQPPTAIAETPTESQTDKPAPDFFDGLASTLNFVRERNVLPKLQSIPTEPSRPAIPSFQKEAQKIIKRSKRKIKQNETGYTAKELEEIEKHQNIQIARRINELQSKRLQDYDPQVNLVYKDDKGYQLTAKEAYKKLSQKFHGTKSNPSKQAKAQSKIEARKTHLPNPNVFDVL